MHLRTLGQAALFSISFLLAVPLQAGADTRTIEDEGWTDAALQRAPADGGVRRWQVAAPGGFHLHNAPSSVAKVIATIPQAAILSSFGCVDVENEVWCEVRPFRGGPRGFMQAAGLQPAQGPDGVVATGIDDSERRARKHDFDAKGVIPCAQERGQEMGECNAEVARGGGRDATVVVTFPNGFARRLYFVHGEFVSASSTMSGSGIDTDWRVENGLHEIRVDDQRYELPEILVFGD